MAIALRHVVKFPAHVLATKGVDVARANGRYTFKLDYTNLTAAASVASNVNVAFQDPVTGEMGVTTLTSALNSNANIQAIANANTQVDKIGYWNGAASYVLADFTAFGRTLAGIADASAARSALGIVNADWNASTGLAQIINKPSLSTVATTGSYSDLSDKPSIPAAGVPAGGTTGQVLAKLSGTDYALVWSNVGAGDMLKAAYDTQNVGLDAFGKGIPVELKSTIATTTIPAVVQSIQTRGYASAGKGRAAYVRVGAQPSHVGKAQSADGAWWEISEPELNQFMFGAVGDGTGSGGGTNDATALQNALNVAGAVKRPLRLLPGTYRCDSALTIPAGVQIEASGVFLDFTNLGTNQAALTFANGGRLKGATIKGPGSSAYISGSRAIVCSGTFNSGAAPTFVSAPIIEGCEIYGFAEYGVYLAYVNGGEYRYNNIHDVGYAGIGGVSCNSTKVSGNTITNVTSTGGSGDHYGIFLDRSDGTSELSDPRSYDCEISFNVVSNVDWEGIDTHGGVRFAIIGNKVISCGRGIALTRSNISGVPALAPLYCVVQGNMVVNSGSSKEGISVIGAHNGTSVVQSADGNVVTGNTIVGHGTDGDTVGALYAYATNNLTITGNSFIESWQNGISLNLSNINFNISGNTYRNPRSTTSAASCIRSYGADNRGYIGGESFRYSGSISTFTADRSLVVDSASGTDIVMGRCAYVGIDGTHLQITGAGVSACDLSQAWSQSGTATVSCVSGQASNSATVSFAKMSPLGTLKIEMSLASAYIGNKLPQFRSASKASTGFTLVAYPAAGGNWDASGDLLVDWRATL